MSSADAIIIVKKKKGGHGAHHGGAWKVAYADFVTAMMAFFLLLWLLNVTTDDQKKGISDYFAPENVSSSTSGTGGILAGLSLSNASMPQDSGGMVMGIPAIPAGGKDNVETPDQTDPPPEVKDPDDPDAVNSGAASDADGNAKGDKAKNKNDKSDQNDTAQQGDADLQDATAEEIQKALEQKEEKDFAKAEADLRQAINQVPELKPLQQNLIVDRTPQGLRIQIVDQQNYSMFPLGSQQPNQKMEELMGLIARVIDKLPNPIAITGHTDSTPYPPGARYTNWELSMDRANAARRALVAGGLPPDRVTYVTGKADTEPVFTDPADPRNRRISLVLLRTAPPEAASGSAASASPAPAPATPAPKAAPAAPTRG